MLVIGSRSWKHGFDLRAVPVGYVVNKVALVRMLWFFPVS